MTDSGAPVDEKKIRADERERCAQLAEWVGKTRVSSLAYLIAYAIRGGATAQMFEEMERQAEREWREFLKDDGRDDHPTSGGAA